jgi:CubicO group peptidase (beta-lactamase class C family)
VYAKPKVNLDTPFFIGSISKQVTAVLALKYLTGRLDSDVKKFLKEKAYYRLHGCTVRQLLHHTSGVDFKTGKRRIGYNYQNENYDIIGRVLESVTGRRYEDLANELFKRAGMRGTFFHSDVSEEELFKKLRKSLRLIGLNHAALTNILMKQMNPSGGVISTARDLLKWSQYLEKHGLYKKLTESQVEMNRGGSDRYGFGVVICGDLIMHCGAILNAIDEYCTICVLVYNIKTRKTTVGFEVFKLSKGESLDQKTKHLQAKVITSLSSDQCKS